MTIGKLSGTYTLVSVDTERVAILEYLYAQDKTINKKMIEYPILFVNQTEGEYKTIYGCPSPIPFNHIELTKLK